MGPIATAYKSKRLKQQKMNEWMNISEQHGYQDAV